MFCNIDSSTETRIKFRQTDITNYFESSKHSYPKSTKAKRKNHIMSSSSSKHPIINIESSDDSDFEPTSKKIRKRKCILPFPISDDEDSELTTGPTIQHQNRNCGMMQLNKPKKMQLDNPLAASTPSRTMDHSPPNDAIVLGESLRYNDLTITLIPNDERNERKYSNYGPEDIENTPLKKRKVYVNDEPSDVTVGSNNQLETEEIESDTTILYEVTPPSTGSMPSGTPDTKTSFHEKETPTVSGKQHLGNKNSSKVSKQLFNPITPTKSRRKIISPKKSVKGTTPKKNIKKESDLNGSPSKTNSASKPEEEDQKINLNHLESLKRLFIDTVEDDNKNKLLLPVDVEVIKNFLNMDVNYQYILMKLFIYLPKWYNITKLVKKVKLDQKISAKEISAMYDYFKETKYIETDLMDYGIHQLLDMLMLEDLRKVCDTFRLGKLKSKNRTILIEALKKICKTQATLSVKKTSEDILKEEIHKHLGQQIKLNEDVRATFYKTYLLQTFTNSLYIDPQAYLSDMNFLKIVYTDYTVENYSPFLSREQFTKYYEAILLKKEFREANDKNNYVNMKICCDNAFEALKNIGDDGKCQKYVPDFIKRFSAEFQYISILKTSVKKLVKYHESVKVWLEYLIENYPSHYAVGFWYKHLAHVHVQYLKEYESGAKIVIEAFEVNQKNDTFDLVQIYDLSALATKIRTTKSYKVCVSSCENLTKFAELPINGDNFPKKMITGQTDRSGTTGPGKRTYSFIDENNEKNFGSVEAITLNYYQKEENFEGIHCEGRLITLLFPLLFFDIIYEYYVPNTFISKIQRAPLDMYSVDFYKNRKSEIDTRLQDIASNWTNDHLNNLLRENWDLHSHEETITKFTTLSTDFNDILRMFQCIDRTILSNIFKRLVSNYSRFHSGMPDLFLWNSKSCKCKFVEVKGEGDKLSLTQMLWIQYLIDIGADVEVCHVSGVGSRKVKIPKDMNSEIS